MSKIILMRHGQTEWNLAKRFQGSGDSPLTDEGLKQAALVSNRLERCDIKAIYSSPRKRAVETAVPISQRLSLPIHKHPGLGEISLGKWEGKTYSEIKNSYPIDYQAFFHNPASFSGVDGGESLIDVRERAVKVVEEIALNHLNSNVLVVSHAITIRLLLTHYMNASLKELWRVADITQTSLSKIDFSGHFPKVTMAGNAEHLDV